MYSRSKGMTGRDFHLTPPPGYDGSRFGTRSDGRDDAFPPYRDERRTYHQKENLTAEVYTEKQETYAEHSPSEPPCEEEEFCDCPTDTKCVKDANFEDCTEKCTPQPQESKGSSITSFLKKLGNEEILLISLIILLAGNQSSAQGDTLLILALLLCIT